MSVYFTHTTSGRSPYEVLVKSAEPGTCPDESRIDFVQVPGPGVRGVVVVWWRWKIEDGAEALTVPSTLDEGDPDDEPYACREGIVARPVGSTTIYVATMAPEDGRRWTALREAVVEVASSSIGCPTPDPENPVPEVCLEVGQALDGALEVAYGDAGRRPRALSDRCWVEVEVGDGLEVLVTPLDDGSMELGIITEAYVDGEDGGADWAKEAAREVTAERFEPILTQLGFVREPGSASTSEEDEHDGADVVSWIMTVPQVEAAAKIIRGLEEVPTPIHDVYEKAD